MAAGGRYGLAQSLFQVGGNVGSASGPLLAAFVVVPRGQSSIAWFGLAALMAIVVLLQVGGWYASQLAPRRPGATVAGPETIRESALPRGRVAMAMGVLVVLLFSKNVYSASLTSYYTLYLIDRFHLPVATAQLYLFAFLVGIVIGTITGGALADRVGRIPVMWFSILGALPFALILPYANLFWTGVLAVVIAIIIASAFSAILVYAQELVPGKVGTISGLFFGLAFGIGGLGAAVLGLLADATSVTSVYRLCAWLPALGLVTAWLPDIEPRRHR
jgi:FSR family fosmidomycin resistance protein-like MFS transporter